MPDTVQSTLDRALDALDGLQQLGEDVEDEWTYVTDLAGAWRSGLEQAVAAGGDEALPDARRRRSTAPREVAHHRPAPRHRLAVHIPPGRARCLGGRP